MIRSKKLIGAEIIESDSGKRLGSIKGVLFSPPEKKIKGFIMSCRLWYRGDSLVDIEHIKSISECIMVSDSNDFLIISKAADLKSAALFMNRIFGIKVVTESGERLGYIDDIIIDEKEFKIEGYVLTDGIVEDLLNGKSIISYDEDIVFGEDVAVVKNSKSFSVMKNDAWIKKVLNGQKEADYK